MRIARLLVLPVVAVACRLPVASASEASEETARAPVLESPAPAEAVDRLLADPRFAAAPAAQRLVAVLRSAGGHAAARGLAALLAHPDHDVKAAALEAIAALGLRSERTAECVRRALTSSSLRVRTRAIEALGRVGDGRDVPFLLSGLAGEIPDVESACLRALRTLSGTRMPASPARWSQWWSKAAPRAQADLAWAAQEMRVAVESEGDLEPYATSLARNGWADLPLARRIATEWLQSPAGALRVQALRLVTALRLADFAEDVRSALVFAGEDDEWAAVDAARTLGVPIPADRERR